MDSSRLVREVSRVQAPTNLRNHVKMERTPTTLVPSLAFPVHRVNSPINKEVLNAINVQRGIYNLIQNNPHVMQ